jgi:hypothetical protein
MNSKGSFAVRTKKNSWRGELRLDGKSLFFSP